MKLAISNIAWDETMEETVYCLMKKYGYCGLEIAPTRILPEKPYDRLSEAKTWKSCLEREYGFVVPSMQSIWYGRQEKMFGSAEDRKALLEYTKKAIDFAVVIGCKNLVFGCPRNRYMPDGVELGVAIEFFRELGEYAFDKGTVIGMEANPTIYNTNFINDTSSAIDLIEKVNSPGFLLNLDIGTMIQNGEMVEWLKGFGKYINHVHISEPNLKHIKERELHTSLFEILKEEKYERYISIEMGRIQDIATLERVMSYVKRVFAKEKC